MSTTYALAIPEQRTSRVPMYGTRAQLAASGGDVEGYLALAGCDKRAGTASYALRIVNQSAHALRARMTCARLRGEPVLAYPLDVQIAPFSISETLLPVRVAEVGPYDRAIVQVAGGDIAFSLEAPAAPRAHSSRRWAAIAASALAFTIATGIGAATATPAIETVAAPSHVFPGSSVDVPYAFRGWGSMQYALRTLDGRQLSAGLVDAHEGTLHFKVPQAAGRDVVLAVNVSGPFGTKSTSEHIGIAATAPQRAMAAPAAPRISEFSVVTPIVHANGYLKLSYATTAREGEVWLIDDAGRLWLREPMNSAGISMLKLPQGTAGRQMRAVLHARNGKQDTLASVAFTVLPDAQVDSAGIAMTNPPANSGKMPSAALTLSSDTVAPGETITVAIDGKHGDTQISLNDASGNSIEQGDIPAGQSAVTLSAPSVTASTTFYVMANVTQGVGEQTLVHKIMVMPR
jgi:hypothetical protein